MSLLILIERLFEAGLIRRQPGKDRAIHTEEAVGVLHGKQLGDPVTCAGAKLGPSPSDPCAQLSHL